MKKLTLLVAGLAMGLASAFAASGPCAEANSIEGVFTSENLTAFGTEWQGGGAHRYGDVTFSGYTADYNWFKVVLAGDPACLRIDDSGVAAFWNADNSLGGALILADFSDELVKDGTEVTLWYDINAAGLSAAFENGAITIAFGDWGDGTAVTVKSMAVYDKDPNCQSEQGEAQPQWESQDGSVKIFKLNVDGNIMDDLSFPNPIYWYDTYANAWKEEYPAVNQNFTFAIEAKDDQAKAFCDYAGAGEAIPTFGIHTWDLNGGLANEQSGDFRVQRIDDYIYGADMNASAMKGKQGGAYTMGVCGADESLAEFWFNVTIAFIGDEVAAGETEAWWSATTTTKNLNFKAAMPTADVMPAIDADWAELVGCSLTAGVNAFGSTTGIEDVIADSIESGKAIKAIIDGNVVIVKGDEVYSILGAKIK